LISKFEILKTTYIKLCRVLVEFLIPMALMHRAVQSKAQQLRFG
jgi:hypothetical protein